MKFFVRSLLFFGTIAVLTTFLSSCQDDVVKVNFPMKVGNVSFVIPANSWAGSLVLTDQDVQTKIDSLLEANNAKRENIKSIKVKTLKFVLQDGDPVNNFMLLQSVKAELKSDTKPDFITLGEIGDNPDLIAQELVFPVNNTINYVDYLTGNVFTFKSTAVSRRPVGKDLNVKAEIEFDIEAGL